MKNTLLNKLIKYKSSFIPFHMPGHKRAFKHSCIPYGIDITEVDGFDNLHDLQGVLKETADLAKNLYNTKASFPLVNGSTCGVLSGIYSLTRENKNILIARNCHKSVYNAIEILGLNPTYVMPEQLKFGIWGKILPEDIEKELTKNKVGTVVLTSPTYEGVISDIPKIYEICKKHGAYLFIDCAHGAHLFTLHNSCDICVMSLHKTLPSLTQTAVLNVYSERVNLDCVRHGLSIFETSSPSYILLASIDECLRFCMRNKRNFELLSKNLNHFYEKAKLLKNILVFHFDDSGKIIISACNGQALAKRLRQEKIEVEMASENYVLAIATVADNKVSLNSLLRALFKIDKHMDNSIQENMPFFPLPQKSMDIKDALGSFGEFIDFKNTNGRVCLEYIWAYPPGSPVVAPGEVISQEIIECLKQKSDLKSTKGKFPQIYVE